MSQMRLVVGPGEQHKKVSLGQKITVKFPKPGDERQVQIQIETRPGNVTQYATLTDTEFQKVMILWGQHTGREILWGDALEEALDRAAAAAAREILELHKGEMAKVKNRTPVAGQTVKTPGASGRGRRRKTAKPPEKKGGGQSSPEKADAAGIADTPDAPVTAGQQPDGGGAPEVTAGEG